MTPDNDTSSIDNDVACSLGLMHQLRPHHSNLDEEAVVGYFLIPFSGKNGPRRCPAAEFEEIRYTGRICISTIVTDEAKRSSYLGERLLKHLLVI